MCIRTCFNCIAIIETSNISYLQARRPDISAIFGPHLFSSSPSEGDLLALYEHVLVAALDRGDLPLAERCLQPLTARFPSSERVKRLQGMIEEARGDFINQIRFFNIIIVSIFQNSKLYCFSQATTPWLCAFTTRC